MRKIIKFIYGIFDSNYNLIENYKADDINNLLPIIAKHSPSYFVGDGAIFHKDLLGILDFKYDNKIHAKNVILSALNKYLNGYKQDADTILPMYLRKSQAERMKEANG